MKFRVIQSNNRGLISKVGDQTFYSRKPKKGEEKEELPTLLENKGWELIEIENEPGEETFPVETYPTFMVRVNDKMVDTIVGYSGKDLMETKLNSY